MKMYNITHPFFISREYKALFNRLFFVYFLFGFVSCKKFISVDPPKTQLISPVVFYTDVTATAAVTGIYSQMSGSSGSLFKGGIWGISLLAGQYADELKNYSTDPEQNEFYNNSLTQNNSINALHIWNEAYKYIFSANSVLEGLQQSTTLTQATLNQLEGEARFIRAFNYFYLVNYYGDVPLVVTTDYTVNSMLDRSPVAKIYEQVFADLAIAKNLLPADYASYNLERIRPNKFAASSMLARAYLYTGDYAKAEQESGLVISETSLYSLINNPSNVFLNNSMEAIWQLQPVLPGYNTQDGYIFILTAAPTNVALSDGLVNGFEPDDKRKISWVNSITSGGSTYYYPYKYKVKTGNTVTEYAMLIRLAELYLLRGEARAQLGNFAGAASDINTIRARAGLPATIATDKTSLLAAIQHERQTELFTEMGHRWFDLKRTGEAGVVLSSLKAPNWQSTDILLPVPLTEIKTNGNLRQNPGY